MPGEPDTLSDDVLLRKIGFGSCSNQRKGPLAPVFETLKNESFDLWIWAGDAVYAKGPGVRDLKDAFRALDEDGSYAKFAKKVGRVIGTWDDHDMGINDGGMSTPELEERQNLFLDFLGVPQNDPRRQRRGVYSSHDFGRGDERVRVILLDTRSGRGDYPLGWIGAVGAGTWLGKITPIIAASSRTFFALTGLNKRLAELGWFNKQMLDEEQWKWLEEQLTYSQASVNILVSSVQVLTRVPSVESWSHFPLERARLMHLIKNTRPRGLQIISGDVHIAIAGALDDTPRSTFIEATSSGMTHTCTAGGIPYIVCSLVWNVFESSKRKATMLLSRNYGKLDIGWKGRTFNVTLQSFTDDQSITFTRTMAPLDPFDVDLIPDFIPKQAILILTGFLLIALYIAMYKIHKQRTAQYQQMENIDKRWRCY